MNQPTLAVAVILAALVLLLLRSGQARVGSCLACVLLGVLIGATPAGAAVTDGLADMATRLSPL